MLYESFPALDGIPGIRATFIRRIPGLDVSVGREEALQRLKPWHKQAVSGFPGGTFATAGQVHGNLVASVSAETTFPVPGADGLMTTTPDLCLGIYVADCAAVYLADRKARGIALVHSGKKGTELGIAPIAAETLCAATGAQPSELVAQISPCIRPPHYEVDFAAEIVRQLKAAGVSDVADCGACTAAHPDLYYSYRLEKGRTGRMLALLALPSKNSLERQP